MSKALMLMADGFETVEALMSVDILRRSGVELVMASISDKCEVVSAHNVKIQADSLLSEVDPMDFDCVILPGGMPGTLHLGDSKEVEETLAKMSEAGKILAAICAAPSVLGKYGYLQGKNACCYPGMEDKLTGAKTNTNPVNVDGKVITSRGLGTATEFAFALVEALVGKAKVDELKKAIVYLEIK